MEEPEFSSLKFGDAGVYECEVSTTDLTRRQSFELVVEGECLCACVRVCENKQIALNLYYPRVFFMRLTT